MREKVSLFAQAIKERDFKNADLIIEGIGASEDVFKQILYTLKAVRYITSAHVSSRAKEYQDAKENSKKLLTQPRPDEKKWSEVIVQKKMTVEKEEKSPLPMAANIAAARNTKIITVCAR